VPLNALLSATLLLAAPQATPGQAGDVAALETLNHDWLTAYKTKDAATLARVLADDFQAIYPAGVLRKADVIRVATDPKRIVTDVRWENLRVMTFGQVAVVTGRARLSGTMDGKPFITANDYADIYARRNGRWLAISAHVVRAAE
jgi:ketosteroid isomerase-like protein